MKCIFDFISKLFDNSAFTGFLGVLIGAILDYFLQKKLNKKQNIFSIENKVLEGLMEKSNSLALKINESNFEYANNRVSNELRKYIKVSSIEIDDKIHLLKIASEYNEKYFEIIRNMDNVILYFNLNLIPIYRLSNFKKNIDSLLNDYVNKYEKYQKKISELSEIISKDEKITEKYVDSITVCENELSKLKNKIIFYLKDLNIVIQNELYKKVYKSKIKRIENSEYKKIEIVEEKPKFISIEE